VREGSVLRLACAFLCENLVTGRECFARRRGGSFTEFSLAQVDLKEVLHRLVLHARHLMIAANCLGVEDIVLPGGDGAADLASSTLLKLLDPGNASVVWSESKGPPTTPGLVAFLRVVLERDFLDLLRSKPYRATVYPDREEQDVGTPVIGSPPFDQMPTHAVSPEHEITRHEERAWLLQQFRGEPELEVILRLQLETNGYNAFSNRELAQMLTVPVAEIENRKRRLKTRLKGLASRPKVKGAKHG
jgi:DNA-directed RNA polymerase specialized sigma24 family protein